MKLIALIAGLALATPLLATLSAEAQDSPRGGIVITRSVAERVRIDRINAEQRIVAFTYLSSGKSDRMKVEPQVRNFDVLKVGDVVAARTEERTSVVLSSPGASLPASRVAGGMRDTAAQVPSAEITRQSVVSYRVVGVDMARNTISLVDTAGGEINTLEVKDPTQRAYLNQVKPGDGLTLIETHLLALSLEPVR